MVPASSRLCLNSKKETISTIKSILKQSYRNYEIIVIDGKSLDGTVQYLKKKIKLLKYTSEKDKGIYFAMNKGIKLAKSKWTIFLNSGDIFSGTQVLKKFSEENSKDNDIIYGNTIISHKFFNYYSIGKKLTLFSTKMKFSHQSVFVKTSLLKKFKFNTKYKIAADFDFFQKLLIRKKKFKYLNYPISKVLSGGISDTKRLTCLFEYFNIFLVNKKIINLIFLLLDIIYLIFTILLNKILSKNLYNKLLLTKYKFKRLIF